MCVEGGGEGSGPPAPPLAMALSKHKKLPYNWNQTFFSRFDVQKNRQIVLVHAVLKYINLYLSLLVVFKTFKLVGLYRIIFVLLIVISTIRESGTGEKVTHGCTIFFFERCIQTFCLKLNCSVSRQNARAVREHDLSPSCPRELTREIFLCHTDTVDTL